MDDKERFDQIESLLVGMMQRLDRQEQFNARQEQFNARQEQRMTNMNDQIEGLIGILKIAAEAQKQSEERQTQMLVQQERMLRSIEQQGRRTDATQAEILRMMEKWDVQDAHNEAVEKRLSNHEPRIQRLENDALRQAG